MLTGALGPERQQCARAERSQIFVSARVVAPPQGQLGIQAQRHLRGEDLAAASDLRGRLVESPQIDEGPHAPFQIGTSTRSVLESLAHDRRLRAQAGDLDLVNALEELIAIRCEGQCLLEMLPCRLVVVAGQVDITKISDGQTRVLVSMHPGDCFGEMAIIDDSPRMADAVAGGSGCSTIEVSASIVNDSEDMISLKLVRQIAILLCRKLRAQSQR